MEEAGSFQIIPYFMGGAPKLTLFVSTSNRNPALSKAILKKSYVEPKLSVHQVKWVRGRPYITQEKQWVGGFRQMFEGQLFLSDNS